MRIFITGGTGYIGSAVMESFVRAGHRVDALVRNRERAAQVQARGAHPILGDLTKPSSYMDAAASADGIVHTAVSSARTAEVDAIALDALLDPGTHERFFIYTSSIWVLGSSSAPADESAALDPTPIMSWRPTHEQRVLNADTGALRTIVVRPGIVYGGYQGIIGDMFKDAANGLVRVIGGGENRWPLVYDRDLSELYVRLATVRKASGLFHANDEGDERVSDLVAAIGSHVPIRPSVRHVPIEEARKKMGAYADALLLDQVVRCPRARAIGWHPSLHSVAGNTARLFEEWRRGKEAA